jgi:hypothetical protein
MMMAGGLPLYTLKLSGSSKAWNGSWPNLVVTILGQQYKGVQEVQFEENTPVNLSFSTAGGSNDSVCFLNGIEVARAIWGKNNPATYSFILDKDATIDLQFGWNESFLQIFITKK